MISFFFNIYILTKHIPQLTHGNGMRYGAEHQKIHFGLLTFWFDRFMKGCQDRPPSIKHNLWGAINFSLRTKYVKYKWFFDTLVWHVLWDMRVQYRGADSIQISNWYFVRIKECNITQLWYHIVLVLLNQYNIISMPWRYTSVSELAGYLTGKPLQQAVG